MLLALIMNSSHEDKVWYSSQIFRYKIYPGFEKILTINIFEVQNFKIFSNSKSWLLSAWNLLAFCGS